MVSWLLHSLHQSPCYELANLARFLGFEIDWLQSCIGEVAFGIRAESKEATQPHGFVASTFSTSISIQIESEPVLPPELADFAGFLEFKLTFWSFIQQHTGLSNICCSNAPSCDVSFWVFSNAPSLPCLGFLMVFVAIPFPPMSHFETFLMPLHLNILFFTPPVWMIPPFDVSFWDFFDAPSLSLILLMCILLQCSSP